MSESDVILLYAIRNKNTKEWLFGTDFREFPPTQRISKEQAVTYMDKEYAEVDFRVRRCRKDYEVVVQRLNK
ncbi:hypothetical protein IRP63_05365 [Clostridium botulinum]|uniref:Uncharacterized protein n=1 Tax=Clostridium botulinum C/D str. DC5 TaxID=1443128 RepID=A0A0A0IFU7_CLOBO|nr:hypothetical protein [Clostridium botulinum]KGN00320.1 hypothetical protein Z955_03825 [Clostridium botulinum C/D str. DC5]KOC51325.1 hypothetical protein ADU89_13750 [Clostridium botulinum]KOC53689.1 hypothetical protein ADU90_13130 [Clostridium botulinum]MCD3234606.1 hypothetical protein [Clostridium botulinum D/C]MCD3239749.1 hypothetical protein [Clostridium botulinum D/C]